MPNIKLSVSLPDHVLEQIDATAKHLGLNRSSMLTVMAMSYIEQREGMKAMSNIDQLMKLAEKSK